MPGSKPSELPANGGGRWPHVVTGAGAGPGRGQGAVEAALLRSRGWCVVTTDVAGDVDVVADVSEAKAWEVVVAMTLDRYGRIDGLVNNAGVHHIRPLLDERAEDAERMWRINALGPLLGIQAVASVMRDGGGGAIVNVSSFAAPGVWPDTPRTAPPSGRCAGSAGQPLPSSGRSASGSTRCCRGRSTRRCSPCARTRRRAGRVTPEDEALVRVFVDALGERFLLAADDLAPAPRPVSYAIDRTYRYRWRSRQGKPPDAWRNASGQSPPGFFLY
jgi:hypothetical protein